MRSDYLSLCLIMLLSGNAFAAEPADDSLGAAVQTYEHLATVLVEVRKTEDGLVKSIIAHHHQAAQEHLANAQQGKEVAKHLEAAAGEVANLANEGDKRVQAIRQRLAKAGSTHLTDADTNEDYLWIDSKEKKSLLSAAKAIAQLGPKATAEQLKEAAKKLKGLYTTAIAPEKR